MTQGRMISFLLLLIVQLCTAQIHPQHRTIPIASDEHGNLFFGDPFEQNDAVQVQSSINEPSQDEVPLSTEFSEELHVELPPNHISQPQAMRTVLTDENIESFSSDLYHPVYTLMRSAEIHQNIIDPEAYKREISFALSQVQAAIDADTESIDMDLGTLLDCGDLGPLSVGEINIEPLSSDNEIEISLNDTFHVRNAKMTSANHRHNTSKLLAQQHIPAPSFDSADRKNRIIDEQRDKNVVRSGSSVSACTQLNGRARINTSESFIQSDFSESYFINQTAEKSFISGVQKRQFQTPGDGQKHRRTHTGEKPFKCDFCQKQSRTSADYQKHRRIHTGEKPFKCDFCQKEFTDQSSYQRHRLIHTGERPHQCDICTKQFRTSGDYQKHRRTHTGEKPFECDICGKRFHTSSDYQKHRRIHTGEKPYQCEICTKQFRTSSNYQEHRRIHTGEKPFECDICPKRFHTSSDYQKHRRIHTGEKPYQCDICPKRFHTSSDYQKHRRVHTGEKPYQCDICAKPFRTSSGYQTHRRTHTGEKPFKCDICQKEFSDSSNYQTHQRIHAGHKSHICHSCNQNYCSKHNLIKHVRKCSSRNASCTADPVVSCTVTTDTRKLTYMQ